MDFVKAKLLCGGDDIEAYRSSSSPSPPRRTIRYCRLPTSVLWTACGHLIRLFHLPRLMRSLSSTKNASPAKDASIVTFMQIMLHPLLLISMLPVSVPTPDTGDVFYLRLLLHHKPARFFLAIRTHDAARAMGIIKHDEKYQICMQEAVIFNTGKQLRQLSSHPNS